MARVKKVREKIETFDDMFIPREEISKEEIQEIEQLKEESLKGKHVRWDELKKRW